MNVDLDSVLKMAFCNAFSDKLNPLFILCSKRIFGVSHFLKYNYIVMGNGPRLGLHCAEQTTKKEKKKVNMIDESGFAVLVPPAPDCDPPFSPFSHQSNPLLAFIAPL